jgi:23S rRNA pseudouridine955/2504/2580 synthase
VRVDRSGKSATSDFRLIDPIGDAGSFVDISIGTGRTHQIRVHAAHAGHPVAGDDRYGDRDYNARIASCGLQRMFLHAHSLSFTWPDSEEEFSVSIPLPDDLKRALDALSEVRDPR